MCGQAVLHLSFWNAGDNYHFSSGSAPHLSPSPPSRDQIQKTPHIITPLYKMTRTKQPSGKTPSKRTLDAAEEPLRKKNMPPPADDEIDANEDRELEEAAPDVEEEENEDNGGEEGEEEEAGRPITPARAAKLAAIQRGRQRLRKLRMINAASNNSFTHLLQEVHIRSVIKDVIQNQPRTTGTKKQPCDTRIKATAVEALRESAQADLDSILERCAFILDVTQSTQLTEAHLNAALKFVLTADARARVKSARGVEGRLPQTVEGAVELWAERLRQLTGRKLKSKANGASSPVSADA